MTLSRCFVILFAGAAGIYCMKVGQYPLAAINFGLVLFNIWFGVKE